MACCNVDKMMEKAGPVGACCACVGCMGGTAAGVVTWIYLVWPAMASGGVDFTGRILITILAIGEGYVGAWLVVGAIALGLLGCCLGMALGCGPGSSNDLTPDDLELGLPAQELPSRANVDALTRASREITEALSSLKHKAAQGSLDADTTAAEVGKISAMVVKKGLIKPEEQASFEQSTIKIVSNQLTEAEVNALDANVEQTRAQSDAVNAHLKATLNVVPHQATTFSAAPSLSSSAKAAAKDDDLLEIVVQP